MQSILRTITSAAVVLTIGVLSTSSASAAIKEIFGLGPESSHIWRVDLSGPTVTDLGDAGVPFFGSLSLTNLAMSPSRTLYFMNPFEGTGTGGAGHRLWSATLNGTNTALVGSPTLVKDLPTVGFGIIDGMTVGPDGKLYMTGYGKSEIYRYDVGADVFETVVTLIPAAAGGPKGEFRSDLAFDPITGNLVGLGIEPGSSDRTLFEIPGAVATGLAGASYVWDYYGLPGSAWETKKLDTSAELGGNPDGIAFDPTNGDLYMSGDGTGIYPYDRITAVRGTVVAGTQTPGTFSGIGWDLAFQTLETPIGEVPEPTAILIWSSLALVGIALGYARKRRIALSRQ